MELKGKKIAILGLAVEGCDLAQFLVEKQAKVTGFDVKTAQELGADYKRLKKLGLNFCLGKNYLQAGLLGFDYVFRSPGVNLKLKEIQQARKAGVKITSPTQLFFELCPGKIIGVTGTKGKGTTATLIFNALKASGRHSFLLGNIGRPGFVHFDEMNENSWIVFELSSFQLQEMSLSPHIAVVLFISSEHLDYHSSVKEYIQAKTPIVRHQKVNDFAVLNADDSVSSGLAKFTPARILYFSRFKRVNGAYIKNEQEIVLSAQREEIIIGKTKDLKLLGKHNWENITAAITACHLAGIDLKIIKNAVFSFGGFEHRLEFVTKKNGVSFYNDSSSTIPKTAIAAIRAFSKPIILIAGGSGKRSDFTKLGEEIAKNSVKALVLIGQESQKIEDKAKLAGFQGEILKEAKTMQEAVSLACGCAQPGDIVLLSPACASFDMFRNYKDRGNQFKIVCSPHSYPP